VAISGRIQNPLARREFFTAWWDEQWNGKWSPALPNLLAANPVEFLEKLRRHCGARRLATAVVPEAELCDADVLRPECPAPLGVSWIHAPQKVRPVLHGLRM
jgi:hypothetical protein